MNNQRLRGIEKEIARVISKLLFEEVKNPKIKGMVSVNHADVKSDMKFIDVSVSIMVLNKNEEEKSEIIKETFEGINEIKGFLRKRISQEIKLRHTPEIRFKLDDTIEYGVMISKKLNELK